jgi:hypothetical protein
VPAIVELGRARRLVIGDVLRVLERALVLEIRGDGGRAEGVAADAGLDAGRLRPPLNHPVGVHVPHGFAGERSGLAGGRAKQWAVRAGGGDVFIEVHVQIVVTGHLVLLAAFLVQPHPAAPALHEVVTHLHLQHGADAREAVDHHRDEGTIAQAHEQRFEAFRLVLARRVSRDAYAVEQLARLLGGEHGRLAFFHDVFGTAHRVGRIHPDDLGRSPASRAAYAAPPGAA